MMRHFPLPGTRGTGRNKMLSRLYGYTVEFGLPRTAEGFRIHGAGILSSGGEVIQAIDSPRARRLEFRLAAGA